MEESYCGPKWEEGELTPEFMSELLEWQRQEKKLHRKYAYKVRCPDLFQDGSEKCPD